MNNSHLSSSRYSDDEPSQWIINKLDNNRDRIINSYHKDSNLIQTEEQEAKNNNSRRKRMLYFQNKTVSFGQQEAQQEYQLFSEVKPREKITTPPNSQFYMTPLKKRTTKKQNLYFENNLKESKQINNQSDTFDELNNSTKESISAMTINNTSDQSINKSQQSIIFTSPKSKQVIPYIARKKQSDNLFSQINDQDKLKYSCSIDQEDSYYNFQTYRKKNNIILPAINKGILKVSSEGNILKHTSQKTVSFKPKIQIFEKQ